MKKILPLFLVLTLLLSCSENNVRNNNPFLPDYAFSLSIDTNLPLYTNLQFAGNVMLIDQPNAGIRGVILYNSGSGYLAYDAACPNQYLAACSTLKLLGIEITCPCDGAKYSIFNGTSPGLQYPLKQYRTEVNGKVVKVFN